MPRSSRHTSPCVGRPTGSAQGGPVDAAARGPGIHALLAPVASAVLAVAMGRAALAQSSLVPESVAPAPAILESAAAEYLSADERREFRVRHGLHSDDDLDTPARRALAALEEGRWSDAVFADPAVPLELRARALSCEGRHEAVLAATAGIDAADARALPLAALRARSLALLARRDEARAIAGSAVARAALTGGADIDTVLAAVDLAALRIRLDASAAGEFPSLLAALGRARQEIDRLDPRVRLREAQLLAERHAVPAAFAALAETLSLHPRMSDAWRLAGELALARFEFDAAANAVRALRRLDAAHPFAAILECRSALLQKDPATAIEAIEPALRRASPPVEALAARAACEAARYDFAAMRALLGSCDAREPGTAAHLVAAGQQLVFDRQYEEARATLDAAAVREPAWATPRAELGLLAMQDGRELRAVEDLRAATSLDPNDERTVFTLRLAEELAGWQRLETRHFVIRHPEGDAALVARLLAGVLDGMHDEVCAKLGHEPAQKTLIDVMPDHRSFGVRVTGLPRIHTIAVCTGPTIAIEIPKDGPQSKHLGLFDPLAVLRHEYTHTVTLSMTRNRIPHWLTEAVAVALEDTPRSFENCQLLAAAWRRGGLFDLDEINWAFIRPRKPTDRAQAYAQGHWMVEYAEKRFGWSAMRALLFSYAEGIREDEAMRRAFGVTRGEFYEGFLAFAAGEVRAWGLAPEPSLRELLLELVEDESAEANALKGESEARLRAVAGAWSAAIGQPGATRFTLRAGEWPAEPMPSVELDTSSARAFLSRHPDNADLAEILLRRAKPEAAAADREAGAELVRLLERYAALRPVDPYPHRIWARLAGAGSGDLAAAGDERAYRHLVELDRRSDKDNVYALGIARNRRAAGDLPAALAAAERAVRMNPFDATVRELAAAIAVESGRLDLAEGHVEALVALEPDRPLHQERLARVRALRAASGGVDSPRGG